MGDDISRNRDLTNNQKMPKKREPCCCWKVLKGLVFVVCKCVFLLLFTIPAIYCMRTRHVFAIQVVKEICASRTCYCLCDEGKYKHDFCKTIPKI